MLDIARRNDPRGCVTWVHADARTLALSDGFDLALMTGHVFQIFVDDADIAAVLATARRHATAFAFDTRNPLARGWERWQGWVRTVPGATVRYEVRAIAGDIVHLVTRHELDGGVVATESALRFLAADDVIARVRAAGFATVAAYGDWDGSPFADASPEIIIVAQ